MFEYFQFVQYSCYNLVYFMFLTFELVCTLLADDEDSPPSIYPNIRSTSSTEINSFPGSKQASKKYLT